jgi:hypothetical protein
MDAPPPEAHISNVSKCSIGRRSELTLQVITLRFSGKSTGLIASLLGIKRKSVLGRLARAKVSLPIGALIEGRDGLYVHNGNGAKRHRTQPAPAPLEPTVELPVAPLVHSLNPLQIFGPPMPDRRRCAWPEPNDMRRPKAWCGAPVWGSSAYCEAHHRRAYVTARSYDD